MAERDQATLREAVADAISELTAAHESYSFARLDAGDLAARLQSALDEQPDVNRDAISDAIYRALVRYDREVRLMHDLRAVRPGLGPTIKRGTKRSALTRYLTDVVVRELASQESED